MPLRPRTRFDKRPTARQTHLLQAMAALCAKWLSEANGSAAIEDPVDAYYAFIDWLRGNAEKFEPLTTEVFVRTAPHWELFHWWFTEKRAMGGRG